MEVRDQRIDHFELIARIDKKSGAASKWYVAIPVKDRLQGPYSAGAACHYPSSLILLKTSLVLPTYALGEEE